MASITIVTRRAQPEAALRRALPPRRTGLPVGSLRGRSERSGRRGRGATSSPARSPTGGTLPTLLRK